MQPRFTLRHAATGYIVALVFAFNGLLAGVVDAGVASGGSALALITCLGASEQAPEQLPGQSDHAGKCSCSLSSCCCAGSLARNANAVEIGFPVAGATPLQRRPGEIARDVRADHPLHLRSPPAISA